MRLVLDCFDHTVGSNRGYAQAVAQVPDGLMMRSIDLDVESAVASRNAGNGCELGDSAAGFDARGMNGIGCIWREAFLAVLDAGVEFAGDVLVECAAKTDIQALAAVANCQDGFAARKCVLEDC